MNESQRSLSARRARCAHASSVCVCGGHRRKCKLYRFDPDASEWKERGVGQLKLLENNDNKKIRLLMRQEKTLKIRANHIGTPLPCAARAPSPPLFLNRTKRYPPAADVRACSATVMPGTNLTEHSGSDKAWVYTTVDFAEEEMRSEMFCLRFGSVESESPPGSAMHTCAHSFLSISAVHRSFDCSVTGSATDPDPTLYPRSTTRRGSGVQDRV